MGNTRRTQLNLEDLEQFLQSSMPPVRPSNTYIKTLRHRLSDPIAASLPKTKMEWNHYLIFGLATLLSGVLFAYTTGRLILILGGAIGLARYLKNHPDRQHLSTQRAIN